MEKVIVGVDAGGSKTTVGVINEKVDLLFAVEVASGSPAVFKEAAFSNIDEGLQQVFKWMNGAYQVIAIVMGISGLGVVKDKRIYEKRFFDAYLTPTYIENDAALALYSIVKDQYEEGIVVLSGTGSSVMGIKGNKTRLTEGWGHLLAEAGSAYAIVRDFMRYAIGIYETTDTITPLTQKFMTYMEMDKIEEFKVFMYHNSKKEVAKHAVFFYEYALSGDKEAIELFKKAGKDLAIAVINAHHSLQLSKNVVLGFRGGMITRSQIAQNSLLEALNQAHITYRLVPSDIEPIFGAYYMMKRLGKVC